MATISPAWRTVSPAITGRVIFSLSPGIAWGITGRSIVVPCPAASVPGPPAAVNTRVPGIELTALVSIERIRACGRTERTNVACITPGRSTSSPNVAVPVMKRGSSLRVTRLPRMLMGRDPTCPRNGFGGRRFVPCPAPMEQLVNDLTLGNPYEVKAVLASVAAGLAVYQLVQLAGSLLVALTIIVVVIMVVVAALGRGTGANPNDDSGGGGGRKGGAQVERPRGDDGGG